MPEIVSTAFKEAQATIVLLSGDDLAILRKEFIQDRDEAYEKVLTPQARPNVLFEAGQAMAIDQERTILVQVGKIRKFSDIQGLHITHLDNSPQKRQELITKLRNAHCDIRDISAENRWMEVGNFEDKFDMDTSQIDEVSTTTKPSGKRTVNLQLKQTANLRNRVMRAYNDGDPSLIDEFIDEYINIIDSALDICTNNKTLDYLKEKGIQYRSQLAVFPPGGEELKWVLNEIDKLLFFLENYE